MKCETCLYNKNCQYLAKHPTHIVEDCTAYKDAANFVEMKHGEWIIPVTKEPWKEGFVGMCTNCGYTNLHTKKAPKFCEECGTKMDGGNEQCMNRQ